MQQFLEAYGAPLAIAAGAFGLFVMVLALIRATSGATEFDPALDDSDTDREPGL